MGRDRRGFVGAGTRARAWCFATTRHAADRPGAAVRRPAKSAWWSRIGMGVLVHWCDRRCAPGRGPLVVLRYRRNRLRERPRFRPSQRVDDTRQPPKFPAPEPTAGLAAAGRAGAAKSRTLSATSIETRRPLPRRETRNGFRRTSGSAGELMYVLRFRPPSEQGPPIFGSLAAREPEIVRPPSEPSSRREPNRLGPRQRPGQRAPRGAATAGSPGLIAGLHRVWKAGGAAPSSTAGLPPHGPTAQQPHGGEIFPSVAK